MALRLYNSLTRRLEEFKPLKERQVGIYVCGPTVYGHAHLGHAKSYVSFDILVRYLRYLGYSVTYVQNITDVGHLTDDADEGEDKIIKAARKEKKHPMALAEYYTRSYFEDMDKVNCVRPDISPRASGHIVEQIELVKTLIEKSYAYEVNGSVYFDVSKFKDYGKLSGRNVDEMLAGARVDVSPDKKHPADFALWKKAEPNHIIQWLSPWGMGYPGWHLECSVMSTKYLGQPFDIHGGGMENKFPHHECEIAQTEGATGKQFVRYWLHVMHLLVDGEKMSKSKDNFFTLGELEAKGYAPREIRYLLLSTHYRQQPNFTFNGLDAARGALKRLDDFADALKHAISESSGRPASHGKKAVKAIDAALDDDMNVAKALAGIFDYVHFINEKMAGGGTPSAQRRAPGPDIQRAPKASSKLTERDRLAALDFLKAVTDIFGFELGQDVDFDKLPESTKELIARRDAARQEKRFAEADRFRDELKAKGFIVEDTPEGRRIKRA